MELYNETEEKHLLYNGGEYINEALHYSLPNGHDIHCTARWMMIAGEKEFFHLPKVLVIEGARVALPFIDTILRSDRFGERGVVLVNPNWEPPKDEAAAEKIPVAKSKDEAVKKAGRHWDGYVKKVAQQWVDETNTVRSGGGVPRQASGFVAKALKICGIADPAAAVLLAATESKTSKSEIEELKDLLKKQGEQIAALTGSKKAANESKSASRSS